MIISTKHSTALSPNSNKKKALFKNPRIYRFWSFVFLNGGGTRSKVEINKLATYMITNYKLIKKMKTDLESIYSNLKINENPQLDT